MTDTLRDAAQVALDAMIRARPRLSGCLAGDYQDAAIAALRATLAEPVECTFTHAEVLAMVPVEHDYCGCHAEMMRRLDAALRAALAEPVECTYARSVEARMDAVRQSSEFAASVADTLLAENQRLQDALRWIPCSERLPAQGDTVAVWVADVGSYCGSWDAGFGWIAYGCGESAEVTHWTPLPDAPSAEGEA